MAIRHDTGIVLRSYAFGEADRVVVLLSPHHGKIRTVAKGVRKTTSRFGGRLEQFTHVELVLYEGRNLDTVTEVDVVSAFPHLRGDLDKVTSASTMLEVADAVAQEGEPSPALFGLLCDGLDALERNPFHPDTTTAFLLHVAGVVGVAPALDECASCGHVEDLVRFSFAGGGVVCGNCQPEGAVRLREGLVSYLAELGRAALDHLPPHQSALSGDGLMVARRFLEHHLDRRLASVVVMEL